MIYQLDTDHVSFLQRGGTGAAVLQARLRRFGPDNYGTANDATLLSRNLRDFARVPGLRVEDWTA